MIDYFALALAHGLIFLGLFRLLSRDELDDDDFRIEDLKPEAAIADGGAAISLTKAQQRQALRAKKEAALRAKNGNTQTHNNSAPRQGVLYRHASNEPAPTPEHGDNRAHVPAQLTAPLAAPPTAQPPAGADHGPRPEPRQPQAAPGLPRKVYSPFSDEAQRLPGAASPASASRPVQPESYATTAPPSDMGNAAKASQG